MKLKINENDRTVDICADDTYAIITLTYEAIEELYEAIGGCPQCEEAEQVGMERDLLT